MVGEEVDEAAQIHLEGAIGAAGFEGASGRVIGQSRGGVMER